MGSPITFSGFNQIDFSGVLDVIMAQESKPLQAIQAREKALQATDSAYAQLSTRLASLQSAVSALSSAGSLTAYSATSSDTAAVAVAATTSAVAGRYDVIVNELARAQVTASTSTSADADTTVVADGGTLTIGAVAINVSGPVTLQQLATLINGSSAAPAAASLVETAPGAFRLVLTGKDTGAANAFTVQNALTSTTLAFTDTDADGVSGDSDADNAVKATDASVLVNNILVTSPSNALQSGIPGVSVTLLQKDPAKTVVVTVGRDDQDMVDRVDAFVSAYNDLVKFASDQATATGKGTAGALGRDAVLRTLRNSLRLVLTSSHGSGAYTRLAEVGISFTRTGQLALDRSALSTALQADPSAVSGLFADPGDGAFASIESLVRDYTRSGGFVPDARTRLSAELSRLGQREEDLQARLAVRRAALQKQFTAADQAITRLNNQKSAISSFGAALSGNTL